MYNHYVYFKHGVFNHLQTVLITLLSTLSLHELIVNVYLLIKSKIMLHYHLICLIIVLAQMMFSCSLLRVYYM